MTDALRPCPFCDDIASVIDDGDPPYPEYSVECHQCEARGPWCKTHAEAIAAWNRRAEPVTDAIRVKPLVWDPSVVGKPWHSAKSPWGWYYAQWDDETKAWFASLEMGDIEAPIILSPSDVPTLEAAKAAAQADYDARIRSALEPVSVQEDTFDTLIAEAKVEAVKAMRKFPQPNYVISKVAEEAGEVVKAAIHCAEGRETRDAVVGEMRQTIAMLYRLWVEGDQVHGLRALAADKKE